MFSFSKVNYINLLRKFKISELLAILKIYIALHTLVFLFVPPADAR